LCEHAKKKKRKTVKLQKAMNSKICPYYPQDLFNGNKHAAELCSCRRHVISTIQERQSSGRYEYLYFKLDEWSPDIVGIVTGELELMTKHMERAFFYRAMANDEWTPVSAGGIANHLLFFKIRLFKD
jgi:hypothetical protein